MQDTSIAAQLVELLEGRRLYQFQVFLLVPRPARVDLAVLADAGRVAEELVDESWRGWNLANREPRLTHALSSAAVNAFMSAVEADGAMARGVMVIVDVAEHPRLERRQATFETHVDRRKSDIDVIERVALGVRRTDLRATGDDPTARPRPEDDETPCQ